MQNGLNHRLAQLGIEVVELSSVVPGHARAVVAVVDILLAAGVAIHALKDHRRIAVIVVVVFQKHADAVIPRQIGTIEGVGGIRAVWQANKPIGMLDHPASINAGMVGHHVAGQANPALPGFFTQHRHGSLATQIVRNHIIVQRVRRRHGIGVAHDLLDRAGSGAALPQADQPQPGDAVTG